jgi:heterodisulfide reductase subunit C
MLNIFKALELLQQDINIKDISELQLQQLKMILKYMSRAADILEQAQKVKKELKLSQIHNNTVESVQELEEQKKIKELKEQNRLIEKSELL